MVAKILGAKPFPGELVDYTVAQLDFCLEMHALDNPDKFKFVRDGVVLPTEPEMLAAWERVLDGAARDAMLPQMPLDAIRRYSGGMSEALKDLQEAAKV